MMKRLLLLLVFILTLTSAFALSEDFIASAPSTIIDANACTLLNTPLTITNNGDITSTYFISVEGKAAPWVDYAGDFFVLEKGQSKTIPLFINLPCKIEGEFDLKTIITTGFDNSKVLEQTLVVKNPVNLNVVQKTLNKVVEPCTPSAFEFEIQNTGVYTESYQISILDSPQYATVSKDVVILEPTQKEKIYTYLNPSCDVYGVQNIELVTKADKSGYEARTPFSLGIKQTYDYNIQAASTVQACEELQTTIPLTIENTNRIGNKYNIEIDAPKFVELENNSLIVQSNESRTTNIQVNPGVWNDKNNRTNNIFVKVVSERGDVVQNKTITVNIEHCYDATIALEDTKYVSVQGETTSFPIVIQNTGSRNSQVGLNLLSANWISIDKEFLSLNTTQFEQINLKVQTPHNASSQKTTLLTTIPQLNKTIETNIIIDVTSAEKAYLIGIQKQDEDENGIPFLIRHKGIRSAIYTLSLEAPQGMDLERESIELNPDEETVIYVTSSEDLNGKFAVTIGAQTKDLLYEKKTTLIVGEYTSPYLKLLWLIPLVILIALLFLLIRKIKKNRKDSYFITRANRSPRKWLKWLLLLLLLILLVTGAIFAFNKLNTTEEKTEENLNLFEVDPSTTLIQTNNEEELTFTLRVFNPTNEQARFTVVGDNEWVQKQERSFDVSPLAEHITTFTVTPDYEVLNEKDYSITFKGHLENSEIEYDQEVTHTLTNQKNSLSKLIPWIIAGLVLLILLIAIISILGRESKEVEEKPVKKQKETQTEKSSIEFNIPWKWILLGLVAFALILLLFFIASKTIPLAVAAFTNIDDSSNNSNTDLIEEVSEIQKTQAMLGVDRSDIAGKGNVLKVKPGEVYELPISIHNPSDVKTKIVIEIDNDIATILDDSFIIYPQDTHETILNIITKENFTQEVITIKAIVNNKTVEKLDLIVKESKSISLFAYAIVGLIILGLIIFIIEKKPRRKTSKTRLGLK